MKKCSSNSPEKRSPKTNDIGRRDFGRLVALALAGSTVASASEFDGVSRLAFREQEPNQPHLSSAAQAEIETKLRHIFGSYGDRLNDAQKKLMRRTVTEHVRMLEAIRPIHEANGDSPATVLKLIRGEAAASAKQSSSTSAQARRIAKTT